MNADLWIIRSDSVRCRSFVETKPMTGQPFIELVDAFRVGAPMGVWWKPNELRLFPGGPGEENQEQIKPIPDYTHGPIGYALSGKARLILGSLIARQVEFLPLVTEVGPYFIMNVRRVDALDQAHSVVTWYESGSGIMDVQEYAFHWTKIKGLHIFCLSELGATPIFVSNEFKKTVEKNRLTGFTFVLIPIAKAANE